MHPGLAKDLALSEWLRRQVKLHPLQVEAQTCADGLDEALFQGLEGRGGDLISFMKTMIKGTYGKKKHMCVREYSPCELLCV